MNLQKSLFIALVVALPFLFGACTIGGASKSSPSVLGGIFKTVDFGKTWQVKSSVATVKATPVNINELDIYSLVSDPQDPNTLYIGTSFGLFYSYDFGESWNQARGMKTGKVNGVAVHPIENCTVFATTGRYVYKTKDCGRTFESIHYNDSPSAEVDAIAVDTFNPEIIYIGTMDGDLIKTIDGGKTWKTMYRFKKPVHRIVLGKDTRIVWAGVYGTGAVLSEDGGESWSEESVKGQKGFSGSRDVRDLAYDPNSNTLITASKYGLIKTSDNGATWESLPILSAPGELIAYSVAFNPNNAQQIFYGTDRSFNYSNDGGQNWAAFKIPAASWVYCVLVQGTAQKTDTAANVASTNVQVLIGLRKPPKQ
jgi:photosystem II stability/assembly factor-like uncharacterized protein